MQTALDASREEQQPLPRRKWRLPISFMLGGLAILGAVIYLVYANTQGNAMYYMTVPELKSCASCMTQPVRVAGVVEAKSIVQEANAQQIRFTIADSGQSLQVVYNGIVPDIFRPGLTVVVEGLYTGHGPFQATTLLTKCPSTFQTALPGT
ncbi:MAG TPA: cytochrome c maturation protein CcmE [Ktedonobacteraceae bacterium]|nr:cytochrome c maturation protein CcmE [Ktedonobacteraceae bacterium]